MKKTRRSKVRVKARPKIREMFPCEVCGHAFGQRHRINPGSWGGTYDSGNVAWLCPNHHAAIHLLMKWYGRRLARMGESENLRYTAYFDDLDFVRFFNTYVKPVVIERLKAEGKWHPYVRTLPPAMEGS